MRFVVAVTNNSWFTYLRERQLEEVNFWSPGTASVSLPVGTPWLFKLHAPVDCVVGGGYFTRRTQLPLRVAWDTFGNENGADDLPAFRRLIGKDQPGDPVGCTILCETFYWPEELWLPPPPGWARNIVSYKTHDTQVPEFDAYWRSVQERLPVKVASAGPPELPAATGKPALYIPRLGQGAFRAGIIDVYDRRCAITGERTLPALEAAHIVPFSEVKRHDLTNGLLLRADLHKLFDDGYVTVDSQFRFHVSKRIRDEFENGRDYYALEGRPMRMPSDASATPDRQCLERHATTVYKG